MSDARAAARRRVGHNAVMLAVGLFDNWIAAEVKIRVTRVAVRPATGLWGERADLFGDGQAWVGVVRSPRRGYVIKVRSIRNRDRFRYWRCAILGDCGRLCVDWRWIVYGGRVRMIRSRRRLDEEESGRLTLGAAV
jgi:hypothetical protein